MKTAPAPSSLPNLDSIPQATPARKPGFLSRGLMKILAYPAEGAVRIYNTIEHGLSFAGGAYLALLAPSPILERLRWRIGAWRAWSAFYKAHAEVPAYREYIKSHGGLPSIGLNGNLTPDLTSIPETDKKSYVQAYSIYDRLVFGRLPSTGVTADESSGSSGTPTNWVRGRAERETVSRMMQLSFRQSVDQSRPTFILNAFALGAWATGINVSMSLVNTSNL